MFATFDQNVVQTLRKLTNKGFLNVKVKRFHNLNTTLPQRFHNVILLAGKREGEERKVEGEGKKGGERKEPPVPPSTTASGEFTSML